MATQQKLDWQDTGTDAGAELSRDGRRVLAVGDGTVGYTATLPESVTIAEALADFAASYDAGDEVGMILVDWIIYRDGQEIHRGQWAFEVPQ